MFSWGLILEIFDIFTNSSLGTIIQDGSTRERSDIWKSSHQCKRVLLRRILKWIYNEYLPINAFPC